MAESYGWAGKILRVNLTTGEITTQDDEKYHKYIGGMGMAYRIMYEEAPMELDPYDEKALVIFGVGPLTGAGVPCSGRMNVTFRSTWSKGHSIIDAHMGGHIGSMLKYAGYDGIVVSGISEKPVYLRIEDGEVSLEDASEIWGKGTFAANKWMVEQNGREFETASIGPAGENLVDYSTLNTSFGNSGGAGLGAAQDIPPGNTGGDGLFLDHGGRLIAILGQSGLNGRRDPKGCKGCHKTNSFLSCVPFPLGGALGFQGSSSRK